MLGKSSDPKLSIKAVEAKGLLEFVCKIFEEDVPKLQPAGKKQGDFLLACGKAAWRVELNLRNSGAVVLSRDQRQQLLNDYTHHVSLFHRAGGTLKPKHPSETNLK